MTSIPSDAPPSYDEVATNSSVSRPSQGTLPHKSRNGIHPRVRRSMEDEGRSLPTGWIRSYDSQNHHQFFVDTNVEPPRSIWHHPYDDEQYLNNLDPAERQKVKGLLKIPSQADLEAESSEDDGDGLQQTANASEDLPPRPSDSQHPSGITKFGRRIKDKMTSTTHEERELQRQRRAEQERKMYERHMQLRNAMSQAAQTGQPQFVGKDRNGKDVYIEPPQGMGPPQGAYGYNPYTQGPYTNPNATFVRPQYPYARPYGGGYGGGFGLPLAGGLMGGLLLGDIIGGGMMGGGMF